MKQNLQICTVATQKVGQAIASPAGMSCHVTDFPDSMVARRTILHA